MPYIDSKQRDQLKPLIEPLARRIAECAAGLESEAAFAGLLNYAVTELTLALLRTRFSELRYWIIATTCGALHNAADEFYRRVGYVYEDRQIATHGDLEGYAELLALRKPKQK
jgi:hypothetical protein